MIATLFNVTTITSGAITNWSPLWSRESCQRITEIGAHKHCSLPCVFGRWPIVGELTEPETQQNLSIIGELVGGTGDCSNCSLLSINDPNNQRNHSSMKLFHSLAVEAKLPQIPILADAEDSSPNRYSHQLSNDAFFGNRGRKQGWAEMGQRKRTVC